MKETVVIRKHRLPEFGIDITPLPQCGDYMMEFYFKTYYMNGRCEKDIWRTHGWELEHIKQFEDDLKIIIKNLKAFRQHAKKCKLLVNKKETAFEVTCTQAGVIKE